MVVAVMVPLLASKAKQSEKVRSILLACMAFAPCQSRGISTHIMSMEHYRGPDRGFAVTLTDLFAWSLLAYLVSSKRREIAWLPNGWYLMGGFFLAALISATQAPMLIGSLFTLWTLVRLYVICWVAMNAIRTGINPRYLYYGFVVMGLVLGIYCAFQKYRMGMYRVTGFFDHSNTIPLFELNAMSFVLITALGDKQLTSKWAWAGVFAVLAMTFGIVATQSRMGVAVSIGCLVATLVLANILSDRRRTRVVSAVVFSVLLVGAGMAAKTMINRIKTAPESSAKAREEFNIAADMMTKDHPLGVGINNYSNVLSTNSRYNAHIEVMASEIEEGQAGNAHHIYKLTAAETGRWGLAWFMSIIVFFLMTALVAAWRMRKSLYGYQALSLMIGSICVHIIGNFEWALRVDQVGSMFAIVCGSIAGFGYLGKNVAKRRKMGTTQRTREPKELGAVGV